MFWKTALLAAAAACASGALAQLTVEAYDREHFRWPYQPGCDYLELNISARTVLTKDHIFLISDVNRNDVYTNGTVRNTPYELLIGEIALSTAFSTEDYKVDWHVAPKVKYDFDFFTYSETSKRLIFAGEVRQKYGVANTSKTVFSYDPIADTVRAEKWPDKIPEKRLPRTGAFINVPEMQVAYYFGPIPRTLLETFDTEIFKYNTSTGAVDRFSAPNKLWAAAAFVPVGAEGVVVLLGGTESDGTTKLSFDSVHVYDIGGNNWYSQSTSGSAPPSREGFCTTVVSSQDCSSHQVHVYGGNRAGDLKKKPSIDNHWILTIPGFVWIKAPALATPRTLAACNLFGKRRMLISTGSLGAGEAGCLPTLEVVDLSTLEVITSMNDDKKYEVPTAVVSIIGGSPTGSATLSTPSAGWARGLNTVFSQTGISCPGYNRTAPPPPPAASDSSPPVGAIAGGVVGGSALQLPLLGMLVPPQKPEYPSPPPPPAASDSSPPVVAIAGGVVGGIAAGAFLLFGFIFYRRRQCIATATVGDVSASPEAGIPVAPAGVGTLIPAGYPYLPPAQEGEDGAAPPYHANCGYTDAAGNSRTGGQGVEVTHELESPELVAAELGGGEVHKEG
ncbi:hypothetical protein C7212DRAFT_343873 [Tuber magnatum]|uniref:Galactose oxidase n=1 Tax=Tuber magnatum TaxID=42249 RepID=A0A317SP11_9PEZI|nr:hypothetical protein C7212DRAFT_343873 [Tuber magnatum]